MNKILCMAAALLMNASGLLAQVGINVPGNAPHESSMLDVESTSKGFLPPRMTQEERNAISNPATGLHIFNTTTGCVNIYVGGWRQLCPQCDFPQPTPSSNSPVCAGETILLSTPSVSGAVYSWTGPDNFTSNQQNPSVSNADETKEGTYSLTVEVDGCVSSPVQVSVSVNSPPSAPVVGSDSPVCSGSNVNLTASTISGAMYSWTGPGGFISNQQNPVISDTGGEDEGIYSVTATVNGCTSDPAGTEVAILNGEGGSQVFTYTGSDQTFVVPTCVSSITAKLWGAGGTGPAYLGGGSLSLGGGGGYATGTMSVSSGESLTIIVGQGGVPGSYATTYGGGGGGDQWRGSGGGRSAIRQNNVEMITAGGGGSAGNSGSGDYRGGAGGGTTGQTGAGGSAGAGGTQSQGGTGSGCTGSTNGTQFQGGSNWAGGGGGYYGGGSGGDCGPTGSSAGGGSSFIHESLTGGNTIGGNYEIPGNNADADRNGAGNGGPLGQGGSSGRVIITW